MEQSLGHPTLPLRYLLRMPKVKSEHPPLLILLHGYGSNEADLFALADELPPEFLILSLRAPHTLSEGHYSWFALDSSSGKMEHHQEEAEASRVLLKQFIDEAVVSFHIDATAIYLVGFSQGAIMSFSVGLTTLPLVRGIVVLSGRLLMEIRSGLSDGALLRTLRIFIGHGTEDTVLSVHHAREAKAYLGSLGVTPEYHEYPIGHGISPEEKSTLIQWLMQKQS